MLKRVEWCCYKKRVERGLLMSNHGEGDDFYRSFYAQCAYSLWSGYLVEDQFSTFDKLHVLLDRYIESLTRQLQPSFHDAPTLLVRKCKINNSEYVDQLDIMFSLYFDRFVP